VGGRDASEELPVRAGLDGRQDTALDRRTGDRRLRRVRVLRRGERPLEAVLEVAERLLGVLGGEVAVADQPLGVEAADRATLLDQGGVKDGSSASLWPWRR
jgi:hypothetical protein